MFSLQLFMIKSDTLQLPIRDVMKRFINDSLSEENKAWSWR